MLNSLIHTNEKLATEVSEKTCRIQHLENQVTSLEKINKDLLLKVNNNAPAKHSRVEKGLSNSIKRLYPALPDDDKFVVTEPYPNRKNQEVKMTLIRQLTEEAEGISYSDSQLNFALRARYSLERKRHSEVIQDKQVDRKKRITSRRSTTYISRLKVAKQQNMHLNDMKQLSAADMSDLESDGEDTFVVNKPKWRTAKI
jgi:hypothetical protein